MQLQDLEPAIEVIRADMQMIKYDIDTKSVHNKNDTNSNRILLLKEFINRVLSRYCIYKSDIIYTANSDSIDFNFTIYINQNRYTITITEREIITHNSNYSISKLITNPSIIDFIISEIDSDLYILTYTNA